MNARSLPFKLLTVACLVASLAPGVYAQSPVGSVTSESHPAAQIIGNQPNYALYLPVVTSNNPLLVGPTGAMRQARYYHTAIPLANGSVLIAGGWDAAPLRSAERYLPDKRSFTAAGSLGTDRALPTANLLRDGRVLITGGLANTFMPTFLRSSEIYDPLADRFSPGPGMTISRVQHTATALADGRALVTGGLTDVQGIATVTASAELYDPATGRFIATGQMQAARLNHTATLLRNGKVLLSGGGDTPNVPHLATAELYDPTTGTFSPTGSMAVARGHHTATLLKDGRVLIVGGIQGGPLLVELYNPATGQFSPEARLPEPRYDHTATLLPNGQVLIAGGISNGVALQSLLLYDPVAHTIVQAGLMAAPRTWHTAALLRDGSVLLAGGSNGSDGHAIAAAEIVRLPAPPQ